MSGETITIGRDEILGLSQQIGPSAAIVSDRGVIAAGGVDEVQDAFGHKYPTIAMEQGEPTLTRVDETAARLGPLDAATVVAVGGGSVMDIAKIAGAVAGTGQRAADVLEGRGTLGHRWRLIAVPTTAGSGAEMTRTAVVSDATGRKTWAWGDALRPDVAVHLPELTVGCPPRLTLTSGLDAFVHAVEAATSCRADQPDERALAAIGTIATALPVVMRDPNDLPARKGMLQAASLAGAAINAIGTGLGHNIGHALATVHGMTHGFAVSLGMAATLDWAVAGAASRYEPVAARLGVSVDDLGSFVLRLLESLRYGTYAAQGSPQEIDPVALASSMASPENRPMRVNNGRPAAQDDLPALAKATAGLWQRLTTEHA